MARTQKQQVIKCEHFEDDCQGSSLSGSPSECKQKEDSLSRVWSKEHLEWGGQTKIMSICVFGAAFPPQRTIQNYVTQFSISANPVLHFIQVRWC